MKTLTLWDLLIPKSSRKPKRQREVVQGKIEQGRSPDHSSTDSLIQRHGMTCSVRTKKAQVRPMQLKYEQITRQMLSEYGVRVRKWRSSMSGVAWQVTYKDGTVSRLIESPKPKGPMSAAIFLHEIGHHAIGFHTYKPRCLEEYYAWKFSIDQMHTLDLNVTNRVHERMHDSLHYAVSKALRRGLKKIPNELVPYIQPRVKTSTHMINKNIL